MTNVHHPLCRVVLESMFCTIQGTRFYSRFFMEFLQKSQMNWSEYHPYKVLFLKKTLQIPFGAHHPNRKKVEQFILDSLDNFILSDHPNTYYTLYEFGYQSMISGWWNIASTLFSFLVKHPNSQYLDSKVYGWLSFLNKIAQMESKVMSMNIHSLKANMELFDTMNSIDYNENEFQLKFTKTRMSVFKCCHDCLRGKDVSEELNDIALKYKSMAFQLGFLDIDSESMQVLTGLSESVNQFVNQLKHLQNSKNPMNGNEYESLVESFLFKLYLLPKYFFVFEGSSILRLGAHPNPFQSPVLICKKDQTQVFSFHGQLKVSELQKRKRIFSHCLVKVYQNDILFGETRLSVNNGLFQLDFPLLIHGNCLIGIQFYLIDQQHQIWTIEPRYKYQIQLESTEIEMNEVL